MAAMVLALAIGIIFIGDATLNDKWDRVAAAKEPLLEQRAVQIHPGELLETMGNDSLKTIVVDVRPQNEYNLFHIAGSMNVPIDELAAYTPEIHAKQALNTVFVLVSNDEQTATQAWKILAAESVPNAYILEGGINNWIATFGQEDPEIQPADRASGAEPLNYTFPAALGDRYECASPSPHEWKLEFLPKIKLEFKRDKSGGGCG